LHDAVPPFLLIEIKNPSQTLYLQIPELNFLFRFRFYQNSGFWAVFWAFC